MQVSKIHYENDRICYEQIWKSYWYARYGEFEIVLHKTAGYIYVSKFCKDHGKQFNNWHANKSSKSMIATFAEKLQISPMHMLITVEGGSDTSSKDICGTYAHPILLPHIASWLDHSFAATVGIMVNKFLGLQTATGNFSELLQDVKPKKNIIEEEQHEEDNNSVASLSEPIKAFKIYRRNDDKYPYQAIEVSQKAMKGAVKRFQKSPNSTTHMLIEIDAIPEGVSLYNLIKSAGLIQTNKNSFKSRYNEETLLRKIEDLSWSNIIKESSAMTLQEDLAISDEE
jgi:hypothetical protein